MFRYEPLKVTENAIEHNLGQIESRCTPFFDDILDEHLLNDERVMARQLSSTRAAL